MTPRAKKGRMTARAMARMIERRVAYFNGWIVSEEAMKKNCLEAAKAIIRAWNRRSGK